MTEKRRGGKGGDAKHVRIYDAMLSSPAWKALSGNAVKALLCVASFEAPKSTPNGTLFMSWGNLANMIGVNRKTAGAALDELKDKGFIRVTEAGHFSRKGGPANCYRLTWRSANGKAPTNEWRDWQTPSNDFSRVQKMDRTGPKNGPLSDFEREHGPDFGPVGGQKPQKHVVGVGPNIGLHTVAIAEGVSEPDRQHDLDPPPAAAHRSDSETDGRRECADCGKPFTVDRPDRARARRFCSETCRKRAERARAAERRRNDGDAQPIGRIIAGGRL